MAERVATLIADNIISPLGYHTSDNYSAVKNGRSCLCRYGEEWGVGDPFMAALINHDDVMAECEAEGISGHYTFFEMMAILSIRRALAQCDVDVASEKTLMIISSTKGNVDLLSHRPDDIAEDQVMLGEAAKAIAANLGNPNQPVVISNACISGASGQITAARFIEGGYYDHVIVCGIDVLTPFIVSGFQSLKALTDQPCRPFDEDRTGINLGDAASVIIYKGVDKNDLKPGDWYLVAGAIRNDGFHISSPSNKGEGCYRALRSVLQRQDLDDIAFLNAHGTATLFNDEMESVAIDRAGLSELPVNSLKGYFGHTMGAAGVLETIISIRALDEGIILPTKGYENLGVSRKIMVTSQMMETGKHSFIKMMSGFGGCNAAMLFKRV